MLTKILNFHIFWHYLIFTSINALLNSIGMWRLAGNTTTLTEDWRSKFERISTSLSALVSLESIILVCSLSIYFISFIYNSSIVICDIVLHYKCIQSYGTLRTRLRLALERFLFVRKMTRRGLVFYLFIITESWRGVNVFGVYDTDAGNSSRYGRHCCSS